MTLLGALTSDQRFGAGLLAHCLPFTAGWEPTGAPAWLVATGEGTRGWGRGAGLSVCQQAAVQGKPARESWQMLSAGLFCR